MKLVKKILSILTTSFLVLVILFSAVALTGKLNGGKTTLFGSELLVVLSGSMSPTFDTGSIVAIKPISFSDIQKGDIITFKNTDGLIVTHRVQEITGNELVTKGDANNAKDNETVTADRVMGRVQYSVPLAGYAIDFIRSKVGLLLFLVIPGIYLIVSQIWKLFGMIKNQEANNQA